MADEQKGALEEGANGAAAPAVTENPASNTDAASNATESPEEKIARLEKEKADATKKYEDEKALRLSHQSKVEEANRQRDAAAAQPPPSSTTADPLNQMIGALERDINSAAAKLAGLDEDEIQKYPELLSLRMTAINSAAQLQNAYAQRENRERARLVKAAEPDIQALPANLRDKARAIYAAGRAATVADAALLAKAEGVPDDINDQLAREREAREKAEKNLKASAETVGPGSPRPVTSFTRPASGKPKIRRSVLRKMESLPANHPDAIAYNEAYKTTGIEIIED